jgi:hypothetical protein
VRIPVHGSAAWSQTLSLQGGAESQEIAGPLGDIVGPCKEAVAFCIQNSKQAAPAFQKGPIEDDPARRRESSDLLGWVLQLIFQDPPDRRGAPAALMGQLFDGIAFSNPSLKPDALSDVLIPGDLPSKGMAT